VEGILMGRDLCVLLILPVDNNVRVFVMLTF
jgi:hypothetical protein